MLRKNERFIPNDNRVKVIYNDETGEMILVVNTNGFIDILDDGTEPKAEGSISPKSLNVSVSLKNVNSIGIKKEKDGIIFGL